MPTSVCGGERSPYPTCEPWNVTFLCVPSGFTGWKQLETEDVTSVFARPLPFLPFPLYLDPPVYAKKDRKSLIIWVILFGDSPKNLLYDPGGDP